MDVQLLTGDCIEMLRALPNASVQCVVTSPPYWGLRDYGTAEWEGGDEGCDHRMEAIRIRRNLAEAANACDGGNRRAENRLDKDAPGLPYRDICGKCGARRVDRQIGMEGTPGEYVGKMVAVFREVRRVLRDDGTLWLNLGDSYATGAGKVGNCPGGGEQGERWAGYRGGHDKDPKASGVGPMTQPNRMPIAGLKPKDLVGIPWRVAFALQEDGWYLRSDIIWAKLNPMPESVTDRPTKAHEYVFLLSKSERYFYDAEAIKEPQSEGTHERFGKNGARSSAGAKEVEPGLGIRNNHSFNISRPRMILPNGRNARTVWTIATQPYREAHFATFPPELARRCILAGTPAQGVCSVCGVPWERVVERESIAARPNSGSIRGSEPNHYRTNGSQPQRGNMYAETATVGWEPCCECDGAAVPATVLDPFSGSGTTAAVALSLGRSAIGIELNPEYVRLAEKRIAGITPAMFGL